MTKATLESFYRVIQVTSKWKTLKQTFYFLKVGEFWAAFDIRINKALAIFWKMLRNYIFLTVDRSLKIRQQLYC